jgi:hypothetical protein
MERQDHQGARQLQELRQAIQDGLDSGDPVPWNPEAFKAQGRALLQESGDRGQNVNRSMAPVEDE